MILANFCLWHCSENFKIIVNLSENVKFYGSFWCFVSSNGDIANLNENLRNTQIYAPPNPMCDLHFLCVKFFVKKFAKIYSFFKEKK